MVIWNKSSSEDSRLFGTFYRSALQKKMRSLHEGNVKTYIFFVLLLFNPMDCFCSTFSIFRFGAIYISRRQYQPIQNTLCDYFPYCSIWFAKMNWFYCHVFHVLPDLCCNRQCIKYTTKMDRFFFVCNPNWRSHSEYIYVKLSNKRWMIASTSDKSESNSTESLKLECLIRYEAFISRYIVNVYNCFQSLWI